LEGTEDKPLSKYANSLWDCKNWYKRRRIANGAFEERARSVE
jgi:hypothetical protein